MENSKIKENVSIKGVENHKKAADHLHEAAKLHLEASKYHATGNQERAAYSTVKAQGHIVIASEALREDVKHRVLNS